MTISPQTDVSPQDTVAEHVFPFPDPEVKPVSGPPRRLAEMLLAGFRDGRLTGEASFELRSHGGYARTVTGRVAYADEEAQTFLVLTSSKGMARVPLRDIISVARVEDDAGDQRPIDGGNEGLGTGRVTEQLFEPASPDLGS